MSTSLSWIYLLNVKMLYSKGQFLSRNYPYCQNYLTVNIMLFLTNYQSKLICLKKVISKTGWLWHFPVIQIITCTTDTHIQYSGDLNTELVPCSNGSRDPFWVLRWILPTLGSKYPTFVKSQHPTTYPITVKANYMLLDSNDLNNFHSFLIFVLYFVYTKKVGPSQQPSRVV